MWRCLLGLLLMLLIDSVMGGPVFSSRIVKTEAGAVRGVILELNSRHLEPVEAFLGVPYAAPPIEENRFRLAGKPLRWKGTKFADTMPPVCPQRPPDLANITAALERIPRGRYQYLSRLVPFLANQSEDCLHLNIYIPGSGSRGTEAPYAVLVFLHGESYEWNSGNPYDGSVLSSYGHIITITVNYRLGILGFLKQEKEEQSAAESDVEAALRWIKHNIGAFGGDPGRVTVVGHAQGAILANLLLLSPSAKGLFRRVILLSGSVMSPWALIQQPEILRTTIAKQLGCPILGKQAIACLRHLSLEALLSVNLTPPRFLSLFAPWTQGDPLENMKNSPDHFYSTDLLVGTTTTESYSDFSTHDIEYGFEEDQRNRILRTYVRNAYVYHLNEIFSTIRNEYTDWEKPIVHPINIRDSTLEALSDGHTVAPLVQIAHLHAAKRGTKTFLMHFGYQTKDTEYLQRLGSVRGDDLPYILGHPLVGGMPFFPSNFTRQDVTVSEILLTYFTNFVKTGNPNDRQAGEDKARHRQSLTWEPYLSTTQYYLNIAQKPRLKSHYRGHRMAVWLNLIPLLHQPGDEDVSMRHHHFHEKETHYYAGAVKAEPFTRIPLSPAKTTSNYAVECADNATAPLLSGSGIDEEEGEELIRRSQNAALGLTLAVGCILLLLNVLVFAFIYCQHDKRRQKRQQRANKKSVPDPPPPPKPPLRTCSTLSTGTVKKRVQIQEISV